MTTDIAIRPALAGDVADIARLHRAIWCDTYRDLAPAEVYRVLDEDYRRAMGRYFGHSASGSARVPG
ncbi:MULTISPECIES: hypothetical protein [unclassified Rhizobium]|uniref:hypothetical protein n=1 Tax=unclassified Rhizobium TaxID=2613769 RepID=UPI0017D087CA|nr:MULTISPECIES: hypothetical protein [unclassified Rhizobium]MBB3382073.1 hypothetical protein [Rhizobium sp. BK098]MBB3613775.1 hypothetical protein [Rhizobium sp. BK609]MBB3679433.1 hypothetical protein [Rhizobium sp. BK612]